MDMRVLLFVFILSSCLCCNARDLPSSNRFNGENGLFSALRMGGKQSESKNENLCTLCEEYATEAVNYLSDNKTQTEIISILHNSCAKMLSFKQQCITLVDYYAPLFFLEVSTIQPDEFCNKYGLCRQAVTASNKCDFCHQVVTEALLKLKDPDTQLEIIQHLMKACDSIEGYAKKCKRLVFEYAPLILVNAETFLETKDVCTSILHACDAHGTKVKQASSDTEILMHSAS